MKNIIFRYLAVALPVVSIFAAGCAKSDEEFPDIRVRTMVTGEVYWDRATVRGEVAFNRDVQPSAMGFVYGYDFGEVRTGNAAIATVDGAEFEAMLMGLKPDTLYHVMAFADLGSTRHYGTVVSFATTKQYGLTVGSAQVSVGKLTARTAELSGTIVDDEGVRVSWIGSACWPADGAESQTDIHAVAVSPTSAPTNGQEFMVNAPRLRPATDYKARVWARNGFERIYTEVIEFTTLPVVPPEVSTGTIDMASLGQYSVKVVDNDAVYDGNDPTTTFGVYFYLQSEDGETPRNTWIKVVCEPGADGMYSATVDTLKMNTAYYVRAYGDNEAGHVLGEKVAFSTLNVVAPTMAAVRLRYSEYDTPVAGGGETYLGADHIYLKGKVVSMGGGSALGNYGILWGTAPGALTNEVPASDIDEGTKEFSIRVGGLTPGTVVWYAAYAENESGRGVSTPVSASVPSVKEQWKKDTDGKTTIANTGVMLSYRDLDPIEVSGGEIYIFHDRNLGALQPVTNINATLLNGVTTAGTLLTAGVFDTAGDYYVFGNPTPMLTVDATATSSVPQNNVSSIVDTSISTISGNISGGVWTNNQPCPAGYRIPTAGEWQKVIDKYGHILSQEDKYTAIKTDLRVSGTSFVRPQNPPQIPNNHNQAATLLLSVTQAPEGGGAHLYMGYAAGTPFAAGDLLSTGFNNAVVVGAGLPVRCMRVETVNP